MKAILIVLVFVLPALLFTTCEQVSEDDSGDFVTIPDEAFLQALIEEGVDTNGDSLISYTEAKSIYTLDLGNNSCGWGIKDMTGIEAFVNLDSLSCNGHEFSELDLAHNKYLKYLNVSGDVNRPDLCGGGRSYMKLFSLNVSACTMLRYLDCSNNYLKDLYLGDHPSIKYLNCSLNQIENLYLSSRTRLEYLDCHGNLLESLDISENTALTYLDCHGNLLESLNLNENIALEYLDCGSYRMTSLDISRNTSLKYLSIIDDLLLSKVCVWELPFPPEGLIVDITDSPNITFTTECSK